MQTAYCQPAIILLAIGSVVGAGCSTLEKPSPTQSPVGQTVATGHRLQKTAEAVLNSTKQQSSNWIAKVKGVIPGQSAPAVEEVVDKDDPTRLDNMPDHVSPDLYVSAARLSERNGRYERAFEQYSKALELNRNDRAALIGMGRLQQRADNLDAAIAVYRDALQIYPSDPVIMNDLGLTYARNGQFSEAISVLQTATHVAPNRELYLNNLAACLVEANRCGEAVACLTRVHGPAKANFNVGYLLSQKGQKAEADQFLRQALAVNPNLHQARALLHGAPRVSSREAGPGVPSIRAPAANSQR